MQCDHKFFTSESVSEGHPDKICDQISDALLDAFLGKDPQARVALETLATTNRLVLAGETRAREDISPQKMADIARSVVRDIGYEQEGFDWRTLEVASYVHKQSPEIAMGVDQRSDGEEGAGDQGLMFGYAVDETPELMPAALHYAHEILHRLAVMRKSGEIEGLRPDAKSQLTLSYEAGVPRRAESVVVSHQHDPDLSQSDVRERVWPVVASVLPEGWMCSEDRFYVNPTGRFVLGGPDGDCGLTGRKIIVDTYGGAAPHGGGAFSGKDSSKVDRSGAYICRYLAKNIVAAGLARRCTLQISYAIGIADPLSLDIDLHGTGRCNGNRLATRLRELVDLKPRGIRERLKLDRPFYQRTASYGHFGRTPDDEGGFSWERLDLVHDLKDLAG